MATDDRDVLEVLKFELAFLEQGGYGRSVRTPWKPTSIFQDSISCLNFGEPERVHPCAECLLIDFVPPGGARGGSSLPPHSAQLSRGDRGLGELLRQSAGVGGKGEAVVANYYPAD